MKVKKFDIFKIALLPQNCTSGSILGLFVSTFPLNPAPLLDWLFRATPYSTGQKALLLNGFFLLLFLGISQADAHLPPPDIFGMLRYNHWLETKTSDKTLEALTAAYNTAMYNTGF